MLARLKVSTGTNSFHKRWRYVDRALSSKIKVKQTGDCKETSDEVAIYFLVCLNLSSSVILDMMSRPFVLISNG